MLLLHQGFVVFTTEQIIAYTGWCRNCIHLSTDCSYRNIIYIWRRITQLREKLIIKLTDAINTFISKFIKHLSFNRLLFIHK